MGKSNVLEVEIDDPRNRSLNFPPLRRDRRRALWRHLQFPPCLSAGVTDAIAAAEAGTLDGLIVSMPPQHGKSELCSRYLPAWYLGMHPQRRVILTGYEADFAAGCRSQPRRIRWRFHHSRFC